jgi:DTW domain-containing protein YfiP
VVVSDHRARVVLLQHPREARNRCGTARMVRRALPRSEVLVGVDFEEDLRFRALLADAGDPVVVYPADGARPVTELAARRGPFTLIVVDGTWWQAEKIWRRNPSLRALPVYRIEPAQPSRYSIRRGDPTPAGLATVEAVAAALDAADAAPGRHASLLAPLTALVEGQLRQASSERRSPRHRPRRRSIG